MLHILFKFYGCSYMAAIADLFQDVPQNYIALRLQYGICCTLSLLVKLSTPYVMASTVPFQPW